MDDQHRDELPDGLSADRERAIDELGFAAGAALRRSAPVDGPSAVARQARRRTVAGVAAGAVGVAVVAGLAVAALAGGDTTSDRPPADDTLVHVTAPTTIVDPPETTDVTETSVESPEAPPSSIGPSSVDALLGATIDRAQPLYVASADPQWQLRRVQAARASMLPAQLLLVGEGNIADRPRLAVAVGPQSMLADGAAGGSTRAVRVGTSDGQGRESIVDGIAISEVQWPAIDGYIASSVAIGLDLDAHVAIASRVEFDGATPTLDPPEGFRLLDVDPSPVEIDASFDNGREGFLLVCQDNGDAGVALHQLSARARTMPRLIGETVVAQRVMSGFGAEVNDLDGAGWQVGGWYCHVWSTGAGEGGVTPLIADDRFEAFLASLTIVDESRLRELVPDAPDVIDRAQHLGMVEPAVGNHSAGEVGTATSWYASFTPDGTRIVAVSTDPMTQSTMQFIDAATGAATVALPVAQHGCSDEPISPDGTLVFDGASLRDTSTGGSVVTLDLGGDRAAGVDFSPDGTMIAVAHGRSLRYSVHSTATGKVLLTIPTSDYIAMCPQFFPDGDRLLLNGLIGSARVWDIVRNEELVAIHVGDGVAILSPDGRFIAVNNDSPRVVDAATGELVAQVGHLVTFSRDGSRLAALSRGDDSQLTIWDLDDARELVDLTWGFPGHDLRTRASFSPDGSRVAMVGDDGVVEVRDSTSGVLLAELTLDDGHILSVAYDVSGTRIVTANTDGTVRVWSAP